MPIIDRRPQAIVDADNDPEVKEDKETDTQKDSSPLKKPDDNDTELIEDETSQKTTPAEGENADDVVVVEEDADGDTELVGITSEKDKLLAEIVELRKERRELRDDSAVRGKPLFTDKQDDLADVAPEDVRLIERVIANKGYVKKDEVTLLSYQDKINSYLNEWLEKHPEYLPQNDPKDERWMALKSGLAEFKEPQSPRDVLKQLDRVHAFMLPNTVLPQKSRAEIDAAKEKLRTASNSGGGGSPVPKEPKQKVSGREHLSGFTEKELEELGL